jgi:ubiquitin carboxyl-terminal hydrolase 47
MYQCDVCFKKVTAERGVKFIKIPKLFCVILRRFDFDYFTYERVKLNDKVEFPFILNMNTYMNGYDNIPNKLDENSLAYF